ncbi:MAG: hypothetical protein ABI442_03490 [Gemmatimonadaceae bacterium]
MTTAITDRASSASAFNASSSALEHTPDVPVDRDRHSTGRRLLERFALIAFALYHVPLFLNNYPSLGGGGFEETGLAIRWGHVFTPAGVWVARHVFHMTGPMPGAYQGDNGDVGEEWGRLLLSVVIAAIASLVWTAADRRRPRARWVQGATTTLLRYSIALGIASYGIAKIVPMQFPPLSPIYLDQRLGDTSPMAVLWQFMESSRPYAVFGGVMELVAVVLLCFRRTTTLGALVCLAVMTTVAFLNYAYGVPVKLYSTMIVVSAGVLVLYDARRLLTAFVANRPVLAAPPTALVQDRIPDRLRWTLKVALVGSVVVSSIVAMSAALRERPAPSDLDGRWVVSSFIRDGQSLDSSGTPTRWRRIVADGGRMLIRLENDGLLRCNTTPAAAPGAIALSCVKGPQGELRWSRSGDTLTLVGTFEGSQVAARGRHIKDVLLTSGFRLIADR